MPLPSQRSPAPRDGRTFQVLTVCTGNICRSPQAAMLLASRLTSAFGDSASGSLEVTSAGTLGFDGAHMDPLAAEHARRLGAPHPQEHRARRMRPAHVDGADLVLGMSREHRGAAASLVPSANRRAFTLVEFARIAEALADAEVEIPVHGLGAGFAPFMHGVVEAASKTRGLVRPPAAPADLDIVDPYRLAPSIYRESADAVGAWVDRTVAAVVRLSAAPTPASSAS